MSEDNTRGQLLVAEGEGDVCVRERLWAPLNMRDSRRRRGGYCLIDFRVRSRLSTAVGGNALWCASVCGGGAGG
jgi:hypothetical protein